EHVGSLESGGDAIVAPPWMSCSQARSAEIPRAAMVTRCQLRSVRCPLLRLRGALVGLEHPRLVSSRYRTKGDVQPVPRVDLSNGDCEVGKLLSAELLSHRVVD